MRLRDGVGSVRDKIASGKECALDSRSSLAVDCESIGIAICYYEYINAQGLSDELCTEHRYQAIALIDVRSYSVSRRSATAAPAF